MAETNRLNGKDLINVGVYTAITMFTMFIVGALNAFPPVYPALMVIWPLVCAIPMMLYYTKIKKFGMVTLTGVITGAFFFLMGYTWVALVVMGVAGLAADLVLRLGGYQRFVAHAFSYAVYCLGMLAAVAPLVRGCRLLEPDREIDGGRVCKRRASVHALLDAVRGSSRVVPQRPRRGSPRTQDAAKTLRESRDRLNATSAGGGCFPLRLDPRTKLVVMGVIAITELLNGSDYFTAAVAAIPILLLIQNRQLKIAVWYIVLFALGMLAKIFHEELNLPMIINMIAVLLIGFVLRLAPAFAMAAYFVATTTASELVTGLGRMKVSRKITIPVSVIFRFAPTMREEFRSINDAMRMRGIRIGAKKFWRNPTALLEYRIIPLIISLAKIGNELSAAALTRGLERPGQHTSIAKIGFRPADVTVLMLVTALLGITYVLT